MSSIKSAGTLPITLGPLVLRSETAAICGFQYLMANCSPIRLSRESSARLHQHAK